MLPRFLHVQTFGAAALGAASLLVSTTASASKDWEITGTASLDGTHPYNNFTVKSGAVLSVTSMAAKGLGTLTIQANVITIEQGATIDANGAGFVGVDVADGNAAPSSNGGGGKGGMLGFPGGGGGFFNAGNPGTTEGTPGTCVPLANGGAAFFSMLKTAELGSAGGAANVMPTIATKGGAGGGIIVLAAAHVIINGTVQADGATPPMAPGGVGPGGGSGGTVQILTAKLEGTGTVSVVGGNGVHGMGNTNPATLYAANNGGGGGAGVVILQLPTGAPTGTIAFQIKDGSTGDCPGAPMTGMPVLQPLATGCVDIDNDGFTSDKCGGTDCDDADKAIHPGVAEMCDGFDNDCKNGVDDQPDGGAPLCPPGTACTNGACAPVADAGSDAGPAVDGGSPPDHVEFGGGCALPPGLPAEGGAAAALALGALAFSRARRRSSGRRGKR